MRFWTQNITSRAASSFLLLSLVTLGVVGSVAFLRAREALKTAAYDRLNVAATLKEEEIARWFEDQQRDFFLITQFPDIQRSLSVLLNPESPAAYQAAHQTLSAYLQNVAGLQPSLSEIFVLDKTNRILVSTNPEREGLYTNVASVTYLKQIEPGKTFDPIFYVSLATGKPAVTLAAPLEEGGDREGAILANLNLDRIDQIVRERTGLGETGETYLVGSLVNEFTFISRENPTGEQFPEGISSHGINEAMAGTSGAALYRNYAGIPVIGVYRWLNDQDIALIVEMKQQEAFAPARNLAATIVLVGLVSVAGLAIGVRWLARQLQLSQEQLERYSHQLERKAQEAEAANRFKSEFLANMSHELRTPLNAILGFTQLMTRDAASSNAQREQLQIINRSGEHLLTLINDVLEMSKIEAGRTELHLNDFSLHNLLASLEEMFQLKAQSKGLQLVFERESSLPEVIRADEGKLRQVLINVIGNAVKFTEAGKVVVRSQSVSPGESAAVASPIHLRFAVSDTGPGIAPQELAYLFEPFVQTAAGRATKQGTGLGLPISKKFVELMGGEFNVISAIGQGSTFAFEIEVLPPEKPEIHPVKVYRQVIGLVPGQPQYKILIVEDRWENRQLLLRMLEPLGFAVQEAENGQEALDIWETWEPHLIWMDMRMPIMDGYEATKRIRSHVKGHATVIVALTASAFEEARSMILSIGCDDFVRKPFQDWSIYETMHQHLGVQYVYADDHPAPNNGRSRLDVSPLEPEDLLLMPLDWLQDLRSAAQRVNGRQVNQLVAQIPAEEEPLSQGLRRLVDGFLFNDIVQLAAGAIALHPNHNQN